MDATTPCTTMCSGMCSDPKTDTANCGKCGNACPQTATCVQGSCQCPAPTTKCGSACVDIKSDITNCGKCGTICGNDAGAIPGGGMYGCNMGTCGITCPMGKTECSGACVDVKSDIDNCGGCGMPCDPQKEQCLVGMCCTKGSTVCSGMCTDTQSDAMNCGMCGKQCPMNAPACANGVCTNSIVVEIFPPSGTLQDPGNASVWGGRYYTMSFAQQKVITAIQWRANLSSSDNIHGEIWSQGQQKLATGSTVMGNNNQAFYRSTINFTAQANTPYLIGVFMSNVNTVFPRKDSPGFPFTVMGITVTACWSTSGTTDIFPTAQNVWGPDFKIEMN
jgi:hypothetical protein